MTVKETRAFMEEIKAFYPEFQLEDYLVNQWSSQLRDCSLLKAKDFLENHKVGSLKEKAPNLKYFVYCFENSKKNRIGGYRCKHCGSEHEDLDSLHKCRSLCQTKKYINKISTVLGLNIAEIFGAEDLTQEIIDKSYKRFAYKAYIKQKECHLLDSRTAEGLALYYRNVLEPKLKEAGKL